MYGFYFILTAVATRLFSAQQRVRSPLPLVSLVYLYLAVRRLYGGSVPRAFGQAVLLRIGLFAAEFLALGAALGIAGVLIAFD